MLTRMQLIDYSKFNESATRKDKYKIISEYVDCKLKDLQKEIEQLCQERQYTWYFLSKKIDLDVSSLYKNETRGRFVIPNTKASLFRDVLFPGQTLDEALLKENIPMEMLNIDWQILDYLKKLPDRVKRNVLEKYSLKCIAKATTKTRLADLSNDRGTAHPFKSVPGMQVLPERYYRQWRVSGENFFTAFLDTVIGIAIYFEINLDYFLGCNYAFSALYRYDENNNKIFLTVEEQQTLSKFCMLPIEEKSNLLADIVSVFL